MFGIKKMLKDEEATGIVGAIAGAIPGAFSFLLGSAGTLFTTCIGGIISILVALAGACGGCLTGLAGCCYMFIPTDFIGAMCCGVGLIPAVITLIIDTLISCVGCLGIPAILTVGGGLVGAISDLIYGTLCTVGIATYCMGCIIPAFSGLATAASAVISIPVSLIGACIPALAGIVGSIIQALGSAFPL